MKQIFLSDDPPTPEEFFWSIHSEALKILGMKEEKTSKILEQKEKLDEAWIRSIIEKAQIEIIDQRDLRYPQSLKPLRHAPYFLYIRGNLIDDRPLLAVVGSRKQSHYAEKSLRLILPPIIEAWYGIVSGGAYGVDTLSHRLTLEQQGYTIAILGTGIDRAYPPENKSLFESIIAHGGAIISHFPLGTKPDVYNFPMRNELIAGCVKWVIIPEAWLSSGTLITAQLALEHGRDVFAIPWDIDRETSMGTNMLIATGQAKCTRTALDILEEYGDTKIISKHKWEREARPIINSPLQARLYDAIKVGHTTPDDLREATNEDISTLLLELSMMEISWYITLDTLGEYRVRV